MHHEWINQLLGLAAIAAAGWIAKHLKTPTDLERAKSLAIIAEAAAALVLSLNHRAGWPVLLEETVRRIVSAAGISTTNRMAIERAAAAALVKLAPTKVGT